MGKLLSVSVVPVWLLARGRKPAWDLGVPFARVLTGIFRAGAETRHLSNGASDAVSAALAVPSDKRQQREVQRVYSVCAYSVCVCVQRVCVFLHVCELKLRTAFAGADTMPFQAALLQCSFNCRPFRKLEILESPER